MALYNGLKPDETDNSHSIYDPETGELPKIDNKTESPEDLQRAEQEAGNSSLADKNEGASLSKDSAQGETSNFKYSDGSSKKAKGTGGSKGSKKLLIGGGAGFGFLLISVLIILMALSNSKNIQLAENITLWNMARTARSYRLSQAQAITAGIDSQVLDENGYKSLKSRWSESSVKNALNKFDKFRPKKLAQNLNSSLTPQFDEVDRSWLPGKKLIYKGDLTPDGVLIEPAESKWYKPRESIRNQVRRSVELEAFAERDLINSNGIVRWETTRKFLKSKGATLNWWKKKAGDYKGLKLANAEYITDKSAFDRRVSGDVSECTVPTICSSAKAGEEAVEQSVKESVGSNTDEVLDKAATAYESKAGNPLPAITKVISVGSLVYSVALPLCIIYDGSLEKSGKNIDDKETSAIRTYMTVRSTADQQKAGATNSQAVGGLSQKLGDVSYSVPQRRASGSQDATAVINPNALPQSSNGGTFSLFNVFLGNFIPSEFLTVFNQKSESICKLVTAPEVGVGLVALELSLLALTGPVSASVKTASTVGVKEAISLLAKSASGRLLTVGAAQGGGRLLGAKLLSYTAYKAGGKFLLKTGLTVGATIGTTELAKNLVLSYSNAQNNGLETNGTYADQADMGGNIYAQQNNRELLYGRPLEQREVAESNIQDIAYINEINSNKSLQERYLALNNPNSLLSRVATAASTTFRFKDGFRDAFSNIISSLRNSPGNLFGNIYGNQKVNAATVSGAGEYNIVQWGWNSEEENLIRSNQDYAPLENDLILEDSGYYEEIESEYGKCYTETMGTLLSDGDIRRENDGQVKINDGTCTPTNLGLKNPKYGDLVFRWRLAKRNTNVFNGLLEMQDLSSSNDATPAVEPAATGGDTSNQQCTAGTDAGIADGYDNNKLFKIRICTVQGIGQVNAQIAKNVDDLLNAAKASGVTLTGSAFRTMASQISLRKAHCGSSNYDIYEKPSGECSPDTAKPGYSNHQMGLAIDFGKCGSRASECYKWLIVNAGKYGLENYPKESWHWSVDGT